MQTSCCAREIEILPLIYAFYSAICMRGTLDARRDILEYTYKQYYEYGVEKWETLAKIEK